MTQTDKKQEKAPGRQALKDIEMPVNILLVDDQSAHRLFPEAV
jgi:hypothetical protein